MTASTRDVIARRSARPYLNASARDLAAKREVRRGIRAMSSDQGPRITSKHLEHPDEIRQLGRGSGAYVDLGTGLAIGRAVLEPGWRWSLDLKSVVGTPSCEVHHLQLILA